MVVNKAIIDKGLEKTSETIAEGASNKLFSKVIDLAIQGKDIIAVEFGAAFDNYLENSRKDLNIIKTIVDRTNKRMLIGDNGLFVPPQVKWNDSYFVINGFRSFFDLGNNIIICGTGGLGKTMLMKYLFLDAVDNGYAEDGSYVPIFIRLRKYDKCIETTSLLDYINHLLGTYDLKMAKKQLEYCFSTGHLLLLFDGLDEVRHDKRRECEERIQDLQKKYPKNIYIVSSRHGGVSGAELKNFSLVELCPFDIDRACSMISLLTNGNSKGKNFIKILQNGLYTKRKDFASNPLLLSIMYITYSENNRESSQLVDFYEKAFNALYANHDALKLGVFVREYLVKGIGMTDFKMLFSYLCFHSYIKNQFEFTKEEIITLINNGIKKLSFDSNETKAEDFLKDLQEVVCLIIQEDAYRFTHRSFQSYFAAYYITHQVLDSTQIEFFEDQITHGEIEYDFYRFLWSLQSEERCNHNILFPALKKELCNIEYSTLKNWDNHQIIQFYLESIMIQKKTFNKVLILQRCNSNHKDNVLILTSLLNGCDYFTAIGLTQFFYDSEEWKQFFNELPDTVHTIDIGYLIGDQTANVTDVEYPYFDIFYNKMGRDKALEFLINAFKLQTIHRIIVETINKMLQENTTPDSERRDWSDL